VASRFVPDPKAQQELLARAISDYERAYEIQKADLVKIGIHPRGELLFGLAEAWNRVGKPEKARLYLEMITKSCKDSPYDRQAQEWLQMEPAAALKATHDCVGCHVPTQG